MIKLALAGSFCCCLALVVGCELLHFADAPKLSLNERKQIEKCLPVDVDLKTIVCAGPTWSERVTVEQELIRMKAHASNGKLCDAQEREIQFTNGCLLVTGVPIVDPRDYKLYKLTDVERTRLDEMVTRHPALIAYLLPSGPTFSRF